MFPSSTLSFALRKLLPTKKSKIPSRRPLKANTRASSSTLRTASFLPISSVTLLLPSLMPMLESNWTRTSSSSSLGTITNGVTLVVYAILSATLPRKIKLLVFKKWNFEWMKGRWKKKNRIRLRSVFFLYEWIEHNLPLNEHFHPSPPTLFLSPRSSMRVHIKLKEMFVLWPLCILLNRLFVTCSMITWSKYEIWCQIANILRPELWLSEFVLILTISTAPFSDNIHALWMTPAEGMEPRLLGCIL